MECPNCGSEIIVRSFRYGGVFYIDQYGNQISDDLFPVPVSKYWKCLECGARLSKIEVE
ncbi:TPA: hypothetical protein ACGWER_002031 [Streptococcus agalactiae]|nr:hypothetical protein [Streptococcus agalactiae]HEO2267745.1 hypothetical protein [Streptococcus agalactiae]